MLDACSAIRITTQSRLIVSYFRFALRLWPLFAVGAAIDLLSYLVAYWLGGAVAGPPVAFLAVAIPMLHPVAVATVEAYDPNHAPRDEGLTQEFAFLASRSQVEPRPVHRLTGRFGSKYVTGLLRDGKVFVTQLAVDRLSPEAITFVLGHEVAHLIHLKELRARNPRSGRAGAAILILAALTIIAGLVIMRQSSIGPNVLVGFCLLVIGGVSLILFVRSNPINSPEIELWCDRKGAELAGDPAAALTALEIILADVTPREAKWTGYPTPQARLDQMGAMVREMEQRSNVINAGSSEIEEAAP